MNRMILYRSGLLVTLSITTACGIGMVKSFNDNKRFAAYSLSGALGLGAQQYLINKVKEERERIRKDIVEELYS